MKNYCGEDFIKVLNRLDINTEQIKTEYVDSLFFKPELKEFLTWFCQNVNENNVLSAHDVYEQELLSKTHGEVYEGEHLTKEIQNVESIYPGLFEVSPEDIVCLEKSYERALSRDKMVEDLTTNYLNLEYKKQQQLTKARNEEIATGAQRESALNELLSLSKKIDKEHKEIETQMKTYETILRNYQCDSDDEYFLSKKPLEVIKSEDDTFTMFLRAYIEIEFNNYNDQSASMFQDELKSSMSKEYSRLYDSIQKSLIKKTRAECGEIEMESRINFMEQNDRKPNQYERIEETTQLKYSMNVLVEEFETLINKDLTDAVKKYTCNLLESNLFPMANSKLESCRCNVAKLRTVSEEIEKPVSKNIVLALLFDAERNKINSAHTFLSEANYYLSNYQRNSLEDYNFMVGIDNDYESYMRIPLENRNEIVQDILSTLAGNCHENDTNISTALSLIRCSRAETERLNRELFTEENEKYRKIAKDHRNSIVRIKSLLENGPTQQPVVIPYVYIQWIFKLTSSIAKVSDKTKDCVEDYKRTEIALKNKWFRNKQMLYVWFLKEPKRVLTAINLLKEHLRGTVNRPNR